MPKKPAGGGNKKADKKKVEKYIEDKTFGLKNKNKSHAVQKYIKGIEQTAKKRVGMDVDKSKEFQEKAEKKKARQEEAFLNSLYKQVTAAKQQEVPEGQDAKTILCQNFKAGFCADGDKCKFSHDLNIEFNQGTIDIYTDLSDIKKEKTFETEVNKIAEEKEKKRKTKCQSNIVCKYFLDAVKKKVYGLKWECPNGDDCHYKHYLPKGYILQTDKDKLQEEMTMEEYMNLEEQIDEERMRISENGHKVTDETFKVWKQKRDEFRAQEKDEKDKLAMKSKFTGVQLFKDQKNEFKDDDNAEDVKMEEIENNVIEDENSNKNNIINNQNEPPKTEEEIIKELENEMKEIKINEDLFKGEENLDELDQIINDDEEDNKNTNNKEEEEDNKEDE